MCSEAEYSTSELDTHSDGIPMSWKNIVNQGRAKQLIRLALQGKRLAQGYLFFGPEGVGKDAMAIELARVLNCTVGGEDACDQCPSCLMFQSLQHPNLHLIFALPVGKGEESDDLPLQKLTEDQIKSIRDQRALKGNNPYHRINVPGATVIKITSIREMRRESSMAMFHGGRKVFVLLNAEDLREEAANALLKTLEEPHPDSIIILTTSKPDRLLPTIISRCQSVRFEPLPEDDIRKALIERQQMEEPRAGLLARLSTGSYTRALALIDAGVEARRNTIVDFLRSTLSRSRPEIVETIESLISESEKPELAEYLGLLQLWIRDAMLLREVNDEAGVVNHDDITALKKFVAHCPDANYPAALNLIEKSISLLGKNVYIQLVFLNLAIGLRDALKPPAFDYQSRSSAVSQYKRNEAT